MEIKNTDIARVSLVSEGAVRKAKSDGRLNDLEGVLTFCLTGRLKSLGIRFMDEFGVVELPKDEDLGDGCTFVPMDEHQFGA